MGWVFPVPAARNRRLTNSYYRALIPGTNRRYARGYHYAIDIGAKKGSKALAVHRGKVIAVGNIWGSAYGKQVMIRYATTRGYRYVHYSHLDSISVRRGQKVRKGQVIGRVGNTGQAFGSHLHFEYHKSPEWRRGIRNPYKALERARRRS